jgi:hypothetical protein
VADAVSTGSKKRQASLGCGASSSPRLSKDESIDEMVAAQMFRLKTECSKPSAYLPESSRRMTVDVLLAVASCDSDQIFGGVFLTTFVDLSVSPLGLLS